MKISDVFKGYFAYSDDEIKEIWKEAIIFFDTNVILNFFEYSDELYNKLRDVLSADEFNGRYHITFQAALEYSRNRISRTEKQLMAYSNIEKVTRDHISKVVKTIREDYGRHSKINLNNYIEEIESSVDKSIRKYLAKDLEGVKKHQRDVEMFIDEIIGSKITQELDNKEIEDIFAEGKKRYLKRLPPGYKDVDSKDEDAKKFGDYIIWREMIKFANSQSITHIIFVTDDAKEDWWWQYKGKTLGPRPELIQEMRSNGIMYYQYSSEQFLRYASRHIGIDLEHNDVKEISEISEYKSNGSNLFQIDILENYREIVKLVSRLRVARLEAVRLASQELALICLGA